MAIKSLQDAVKKYRELKGKPVISSLQEAVKIYKELQEKDKKKVAPQPTKREIVDKFVETVLSDDQSDDSVAETKDVVISKDVEVVVGVDGKTVDLSLVSSEGLSPPTAGFLVEVYLSGSDGKLTRVYRESVVDVLNDETLSDGFSDYLVLEVDK